MSQNLLQQKSNTEGASNGIPVIDAEEVQDAIAIIGFCVDFPSANSPDAFWELLVSGRSASREFPPERLNHSAWHSGDGSSQGSLRPAKSYFLDKDIAAFDATFFSITAAEAAAMDPQQRGLLETTYKALENAGVTISQISGKDASVFTGYFTADYLLLASKDPERMAKYCATGFAGAMLSNRISTFFNLSGPSVTIDTACSSSLVALDMACQSLRRGESSLGIVTGCNLMFSVDLTIGLSNMGFLSPDGICHSFDQRANGYARGEGFGALVIKPLLSALRDGDTIRAIIRATGSNQNGRTSLAQPSKEAQIRLIEETYKRGHLNMSATQFVEAHGTGTATGDPIEAMAIGEAFRPWRAKNDPLLIGASKANIGHLEGASGIAGIAKTILVLENGVVPPIANLDVLNPAIDAEFLNLKFPRECVPWPKAGLRRASVNSFGFGGTNSHVILDDALSFLQDHGLKGNHSTSALPLTNPASRTSGLTLIRPMTKSWNASPNVFVWSAADENGIRRLRSAYQSHLEAIIGQLRSNDAYLKALASTLCERRSLFLWKTFAVASSLDELLQAVDRLPAPIRSDKSPKLAFVFTGQGAQWHSMGKDLLNFPIFKQSVQRGEAYIKSLGCCWNLQEDFLRGPDSSHNIHDPEVAQPICTIIQVALVDLLRDFNVMPSLVLGHSSGEIAAAYAANAISRESAWKLAYYRGLLSSTLVRLDNVSGAMISAAVSPDTALSYMKNVLDKPDPNALCIACINSPSSVTISGNSIKVQRLKNLLDQDGIFNRVLAVPVAYHSPQMEKVALAYQESIGSLLHGEDSYQSIPMVSSVTGHLVAVNDLLRPSYWIQNMVSVVNFAEALKACFSASEGRVMKKIDLSHRNNVHISGILEVGPHPALKGPIRETLTSISRGQNVFYAPTLIRHNSATRTLMEAMGQLHCLGYPVDISRLNTNGESGGAQPPVLSNLPQYPFDHSMTYWKESRISKNLRFRRHGPNDFLGAPVADWNSLEPQWRYFLNSSPTSSCAWVRDHKINGDILFPAAGMLVMALEAVAQIERDFKHGIDAYEIRNAEFLSGLAIPTDEDGIETHLSLQNARNSSGTMESGYKFCIQTHQGTNTFEICRGVVLAICADEKSTQAHENFELRESARIAMSKVETILEQCPTWTSGRSLYNRLYKFGYQFGDSFRRIQNVHYDNVGEAVGRISVFEDQTASPSIIHPATLDGILQMMLPAASKGGNVKIATMIPTRLNRLWISNSRVLATASTSQLRAYASLRTKDIRSTESSICAVGAQDGVLLVDAEGVEAIAVTGSEAPLDELEAPRRLCFDIVFKPDISLLNTQKLRKVLVQQRSTSPDPTEAWTVISSFVSALMRHASQEVSVTDIPSHLPHLAKHFSWIKNHSASTIEHDLTLEELHGQLQHHGRLGEIYSIFGRHLNKILKGECDALELLSQNNILQDYYDITNNSWKFFSSFQLYLELMSHKNPAMKILEVGAGTGSTTKYLLEALSTASSHGYSARYSRFDFTDISRAFLTKAEDQFSSYPKIHFGIYDAERDPASQGYKPESYDVLVAANVLHATKALNTTLDSLRKALKTGGKLMFIEITEPNSIVGPVIFGCLPGWWQNTDSYRAGTPCMSEQQWDEILRRNGFSGIDMVFHDYDIAEHSETLPLRSLQKHIGCSKVSMDTFHSAAEDPKLNEQLAVILCDSAWPKLDQLHEEQYLAFHSVLTRSKALLWISDTSCVLDVCPQHALATGFARTLRLERSGLVFTTLTLSDGKTEQYEQHIAHALRNTLEGISTGIYEPELTVAEDVLVIPRVYEDDSLNQAVHALVADKQQSIAFGEKNLKLRIESIGLLESLYFEQVSDDSRQLSPGELEVEVRSVGVNFKDVLVAMGHVPDDTFGTEGSGIVLRAGSSCRVRPGERVIICHLDAFCRTIRCDQSAVEVMPNGMTFTEASSIPTNFITAYRALIDIARLSRDETILIHSGAGGTGQAAVQIAQHCGAKIFVTVSSEEKKDLLLQTYGLPPDQVLFSRDLSFAKGIKRLTDGKGVDVVFNSLAGTSLLASWECIAPYGRFIEIGKRDILSRRNLPMFQFAQNVTFSAIDIAAMARDRPELVSECLRQVLKLFSQKALRIVKPLMSFPINQVENAFRRLQSGKTLGKVVVEIDHDVQVSAVLKPESPWTFDENSTYVIAGGLGGQGRSIARWLASKGARHLLLLSRSGVSNKTAEKFVREMTSIGLKIHAPACDITDFDSLKEVLDFCAHAMPPIKGCFQSSMVIRDVVFEKMSCREWNDALLPKVTGSWNLHRLLPRDLDFFIFLSSLTGIIGSQIQSNYAAGNTFEDCLAHLRISQGEQATSINLSAMESEGILADHRDVFDQIVKVKQLLPMSQPELFAILDHYCQRPAARAQVVTGLQLPSVVASRGTQEASWMSQPMFCQLHQLSNTTSSSSAAQGREDETGGQDLHATIKDLGSVEEVTGILVDAITNKLSKFLSVSISHFDALKPLHSYGIDSLIAMELRNWFLRVLKIEVSVFEVLGGSSTQTLAETIAHKIMEARK